MSLLFIGIFAFLSTLFGGYIAFKYKRFIHIFSGLTAGTLLALIFIEIIPEVIKLNNSTYILLTVIFGFIFFHILEKIFSLHHHHGEKHDHDHHDHISSKKIATWALILHSLFDGIAIGLAYNISPAFGLVVAIGVIAHDFSDGFNTVSLSNSKRLLCADAIAPILGIIIGSYFTFPDTIMSILFGLFAGVLLYVSTSDILPEAHCDNKKHMTQNLLAMLAGVLYIVFVVSLK
ncbi:ZIP family metal transporter [Arenimonas sp.]|nr:ZIP family metal transporter [Candidatus Parcubacteria bacterium]